MKINQVLKTQIYVKLSEIPNLPAGFRLTNVSTAPYAMEKMDNGQSIVLEGEIE